jgi:hypothetical protein
VLNLSGAAPSETTLDAGNVVLAFGSSEQVRGLPDGGGTLFLLGLGIAGLGLASRRRVRA